MASIDDRLNRAIKTARKQDKTKKNTQMQTYLKNNPGQHTIKAYQPSKMEQFRDNIAKIFTASPHQDTQKTQENSLWNAPLNQSDLASRHMSNNEAGVKSKTSPTKVGGGGGRDGKIDRKKDKFSPAKLLLGTVVKGSDEADRKSTRLNSSH